MDHDHRIPPALTVALVTVVLAVGSAAYYAGRFRRAPNATASETAELPPPAAPVPDAAGAVETPADAPPTVTPPMPVVVEKGIRPAPRAPVERSSEIVVPVPPVIPTAVPAGAPIQPRSSRRIVVEIRPTPTPTVPDIDLPPPPPVETPEPPPEQPAPPEDVPEPPPEPEPSPEPEPTALPVVEMRDVVRDSYAGSRVGVSAGAPRRERPYRFPESRSAPP